MSAVDLGVPAGFVLGAHAGIFLETANRFNASILVRKTGEASLRWVGKQGYTAKRGDLKCKTAQADLGGYRLAGLVCSPLIHSMAFTDARRLSDAIDLWQHSQHLITVPPSGFTGTDWPRSCATPYILQTNTEHPHYGVLAWIEAGIVSPKYIHGDYDLYAIVPANSAAVREAAPRNYNLGGAIPSSLPLEQRLALGTPLSMDTGPLLFEIMNYLDRAFGYPMVMHAEQENLQHKDDQVIAFLPAPRQGRSSLVLPDRAAIELFYRNEFGGRTAAGS
ncbi:MAG TPA: hypothetical protein VMQ54_07515 [Steroidobacteraceae bacterium]|nr:hypothetical protein [Steroidobacteraceae bacterium]